MSKTQIMCPECMQKELETNNYQDANCPECHTKFTVTEKLTVQYT